MSNPAGGLDRGLYREIIDWATAGGGPGDPAGTRDDVRVYVKDLLDQFVDVKTSTGGLAPSAEARVNQGPFISPFDVLAYLGGGGLLLIDENDDPIQNPLVKLVRSFNAQLNTDTWDVYIDEEYT